MKRNDAKWTTPRILETNSSSVKRDELFQLFTQGQVDGILALDRRAVLKAGSQDLLAASLVLRGELEEALALAANIEKRDESGLVSFFLGLGLARSGSLEEAHRRLERIKSLKSRRENLVGFFGFQLEGFIRYLQGESTTELSRKALAEAQQSTSRLEPLARILALDLLGHSYVRTGEVRLGLKTLRLAKRAAETARHRSFPTAIAISLLKYEAAFGLEPERVMARLMRALVELDPKDSYSRSELRLELARQAILRGQLRTARRVLDSASPDILGSKNWLQTAWLHLRLAWMAKLEGRPLEVLFSLQSAESALRDGKEQSLEKDLLLKIYSFRVATLRDLRSELEGAAAIDDLKSRIAKAEQDHKSLASLQPAKYGIERRIFARRENSAVGFQEGEDPFGDLMDRLALEGQAPSLGLTKELLTRGYLGILLSTMGLRFGRNLLLLGLPNEAILVIEGGEAKIVREGLGGLLGRLLLHLSPGPSTKAAAIEAVWGYRYDSERHDRLLAVAVTRLRKLLGGGLPWVSISGERVFLHPEVSLRTWSEFAPASAQAPQGVSWMVKSREDWPQRLPRHSLSPSLNPQETGRLRIRQLQVLEDLATRGDVGVQDLVSRFGISRASALRDLGEMVSLGLLIRTGSTRATRYILKQA